GDPSPYIGGERAVRPRRPRCGHPGGGPRRRQGPGGAHACGPRPGDRIPHRRSRGNAGTRPPCRPAPRRARPRRRRRAGRPRPHPRGRGRLHRDGARPDRGILPRRGGAHRARRAGRPDRLSPRRRDDHALRRRVLRRGLDAPQLDEHRRQGGPLPRGVPGRAPRRSARAARDHGRPGTADPLPGALGARPRHQLPGVARGDARAAGRDRLPGTGLGGCDGGVPRVLPGAAGGPRPGRVAAGRAAPAARRRLRPDVRQPGAQPGGGPYRGDPGGLRAPL
ncbi:MAG: hypothetical protein AVDCRST_MAG18-3784, partial [uncultured Thermomicrobiales bacterium]